jgi:DNA-binding NarL/FixJ family response regulator
MIGEPHTVVLIDDHSLFRQGVRALIGAGRSIQVVGEGVSSDDALELAREHQPDVMLLDVEIPGIPAEQTIKRLRRSNPEMAIVVLTMHSDTVLERQLLRAGAAKFLPKTLTSDALAQIIAETKPPSCAYLGQGLGLRDSDLPILTEREQEVLRMVAQAHTNRDISSHLGIAEGTVKRHTTNIYAKLGATSRIDAVRKATRLGIMG